MSNMLAESSFVVALSLLVGCSGADPEEDFTESGQAIIEPAPTPTPAPTVTTGPTLPPFLPLVQTVASSARPTSIALDGSKVYYTDTSDVMSEVASRPLGGGAKTVLHSTYTLPSSLVRFGSTLYWVDFTHSSPDGGVWTAPASGATPAVKLVSHTNSVTAHRALAVYSTGSGLFAVTHVLYADAWASKVYDIRRSLIGSTSEVSLVPDAFPNYYPFSIAIDGTHIYFTHDVGHGLWRVPFAGGVPTSLVGSEEPDTLVVTGGQLYFVKDGDIKTKPAAGGATSTFAESVGTIPSMVAANGYLYWACSSCSTIRKKPLSGGSVTLLASGHANLRSLAVDATHIYFGTDSALKRTSH